MAKIDFPKHLKSLLEDSDLQAPLRTLADRVGEILADNKLPFFPDYTDHGTDHINRVLKSEVELVPTAVWEKSQPDSHPRLLCDADAAVIIGATLLHDIAMHLRPAGFRELVDKNSRFQPLGWFREDQEGHSADRPWHELWDEYAREARRFSDRSLGNIIGQESVRLGWKFQDLPEDAGKWEHNHFLVIGEFVRRHHARLAHEIAIYGFPGPPLGSGEGQFPALGTEQGHPLMRLADLIGLTARSHGMSLRVCKAYLDSSPLHAGTPRPAETAVLFPMALLRVADYLQIDRQRAPAVLLQLRNPQSPISVQEWKKHLAVLSINTANNPRGKMITVDTNVSLELYLQLRELLSGLQAEMDHATAVLDEAYGTRSDLGLDQLNLAARRVYSNLHSQAFRDSLPYVSERTGFEADPNLLTLLVEPLYGKYPGVGVRELMQNAVDAVCELEVWCKTHDRPITSLDLPKQDADVLIDFIKRDDGTWMLRVTDKGIGMTHETIQKYFLRAGASFRQSAAWAKEFLDDKGQPRVLRAGRFGIGAFAVFLLGPTFRMWTRHVSADNSMGYAIEASADSHLIKIRRVESLPVGTKIEVEISSETAAKLELESEKYGDYSGPNRKTDWFCWDSPSISRRVNRAGTTEELVQRYTARIRMDKPSWPWSVISPTGFRAVFWTFGEWPALVCNGLRIAHPGHTFQLQDVSLAWSEETQLRCPCIAVLDHEANLPLTIQRYELSRDELLFSNELARDVTLSFIAHALVCGPKSRDGVHSTSWRRKHPLALGTPTESSFGRGLLRWCSNSNGFVPADPWLYSLVHTDACLVYGILDSSRTQIRRVARARALGHIQFGQVTLNWNGHVKSTEMRRRERAQEQARIGIGLLNRLSTIGISALRHDPIGIRLIFSASEEMTSAYAASARFSNWRFIECGTSKRQRFESCTGVTPQLLPLDAILLEFERDAKSRSRRESDCLYVAEIRTAPNVQKPETLISIIWNECLGPKAIPFDPDARRALIEHGRQHPELKRHIEAWEEMKRTSSKYAVGDSSD